MGDWLFNETLHISYNGLSKEACINLATYNWGDQQNSGLIGIAVGSGEYVSDGGLMFDNSGNIKSKGCSVQEFNGWDRGVCIGTTMPVSTAASVCYCHESGCGIGFLYR